MDYNEIIDLLKELKERKLNADIDNETILTDDCNSKWRYEVDANTFLTYFKVFSDEVKVEALSVLVASKKTTLIFEEKELELIFQFVVYNLGEKLEFISFIKKTFLRIKSSLAILQRNLLLPKQLEKIPQTDRESKSETYEKLQSEYHFLAEKSQDVINYYKKFFTNIRQECLDGLFLGATHYRKKNSLFILQLQEEILSKEFVDVVWRKDQAQVLYKCLLLDTYEMNKETTFKIIKLIEPSKLNLDDEDLVNELMQVALMLGNNLRPIDSITASFIFKLCLLSPVLRNVLQSYRQNGETVNNLTLELIIIILKRLKDCAKLAEENIISTASKHSLYGYVFCIRALMSSCDLKSVKCDHELWLETIEEIISTCLHLNETVSCIVNNSSPEGHFPMDLDNKSLNLSYRNEEGDLVTPQMVLLCGWRTVKEISLLFGFLVSKLPIKRDDSSGGVLVEQQIVSIGEHLVTLLCETKHRGAFEQAHVAFEQFCTRLWLLEEDSLKELLKLWLYQLLLAITGLSGNAKLCATRRSAGVPFMIQAIVVTEPSIKSKKNAEIFHSIIRILLGLTELEDEADVLTKANELIAAENYFKRIHQGEYSHCSNIINSSDKNDVVTITEVKTHAFNILRALFKHAQLGNFSKDYAAKGLIAAIKSYNAKTWAERNSATLLFSALITRIFGVQRTKNHINLTAHNKMTGRLFFEKYPELLSFMIEELKVFVDGNENISMKPGIQLILLLLSRLYINVNSDENDFVWKVEEFLKLTSACSKSKVYTTRELTARAVVPLLTKNTVVYFLNGLFYNIYIETNNIQSKSRWNIIHGCLLQSLEIVKSQLFKNCKLSDIYFEEFIKSSMWMFNNLDKKVTAINCCFPLLSTFIDLLSEMLNIYNIKGELFPYNLYSKVLKISLKFLCEYNSMGLTPGKELYEISVIKFFINWILTVKQVDYLPDEGKTFEILTIILSHKNDEIKIYTWKYLINILKHLKTLSVDINITNIIELSSKNIQTDNIDLKQVIYNCLSDQLINLDTNSLVSMLDDVQSPNILKLLSKKLPSILENHPETIRRHMAYFGDHLWMNFIGIEYRLAIVPFLFDLYQQKDSSLFQNDEVIKLDWWTILLRCLVDDNFEVRKSASEMLSTIEPSFNEDHLNPLELFFHKFYHCDTFLNDSAKFAAFFVWSLSLSGENYEMDEDGVFNKCYNYEVYEPFRIINQCKLYLNKLLDVDKSKYNKLKMKLSSSSVLWIKKRLNMIKKDENNVIIDPSDAQIIIDDYRNIIPTLKANLFDLSDPTFNDKLLQHMAYQIFSEIIYKSNEVQANEYINSDTFKWISFFK